MVPEVDNRDGLVKRLHKELGHFGVKRVISMLQRDYWWRGMGDDVVRVVGACMPCARVKVGFQESHRVRTTSKRS